MANKSKHIHKYHQVGKFSKLWACALPECNHYMPKHLEDMLPGKASICWDCGDKFILDERALGMTKPVCLDCTPEGRELKENLISRGLI